MRCIHHHAQSCSINRLRESTQDPLVTPPILLGLSFVCNRWGGHAHRLGEGDLHRCLKCTLLSIWNLAPITREHLQAVVLDWIVRGGDDHAAGGTRFSSND
jgi:hypothetical protein